MVKCENPDLEGARPPDPDLEGTVLSGLCAAPSVPKPSLEPLSGPLAHPVTTCATSARRSLVMAAVEQPVPVLSIVDPDGRLHEVPRRIFNVWCKEMGITRADNLSRACNNRGLAGWHFSNETADKHGAWQPLHKLVFLQTSDAVRQTTGSTCVGGQSPRRALERSPHALFKLRQKAQCVWLVARWTAWLE